MYPASNYYTFNTVYTSVATLPNGMVPGNQVWDPTQGRMYELDQVNGNVAANAAVKLDPGVAGAIGQVLATAAATDGFHGVNDQSSTPGVGAALVAGNVAWFTILGDAFPLVANATAAGTVVIPSGTAGTLAIQPGTGLGHPRAVTRVVSTGVATQTRLY